MGQDKNTYTTSRLPLEHHIGFTLVQPDTDRVEFVFE